MRYKSIQHGHFSTFSAFSKDFAGYLPTIKSLPDVCGGHPMLELWRDVKIEGGGSSFQRGEGHVSYTKDALKCVSAGNYLPLKARQRDIISG